MKTALHPIFPGILLIIAMVAATGHNANAQVSRSKNKSSKPYQGSYQRMAAGNIAYSTRHIRGCALWAWGSNGDGELGDGTTTGKNSPTQIGTDTKWVSIAVGSYHTIALKSDGTLWAWGYNGYGQL